MFATISRRKIHLAAFAIMFMFTSLLGHTPFKAQSAEAATVMTIRGRTMSNTGTALPNATVELYNANRVKVGQVRSDGYGNFAITAYREQYYYLFSWTFIGSCGYSRQHYWDGSTNWFYLGPYTSNPARVNVVLYYRGSAC